MTWFLWFALGVVFAPADVLILRLLTRPRFSLKLFLVLWVVGDAGGLTTIAIAPHQPHGVPGAAGMAVSVLLALGIWWWKRKRPDKAARALGAKSRARIDDLVRAMRETATPSPRPAWGGAR